MEFLQLFSEIVNPIPLKLVPLCNAKISTWYEEKSLTNSSKVVGWALVQFQSYIRSIALIAGFHNGNHLQTT